MIRQTVLACLAILALSVSARADPVAVEAVLAPTDVIRMEFEGSKHFVAMVRREGTAEGSGPFAGASVVEHGWHDIRPPEGGDPQGYLALTTGGDTAYLKFTVRAVFLGGGEKPRLIDYGFWELVEGTGRFASMTGAGTLQIKPASKTERLFVLEGEIGPRP